MKQEQKTVFYDNEEEISVKIKKTEGKKIDFSVRYVNFDLSEVIEVSGSANFFHVEYPVFTVPKTRGKINLVISADKDGFPVLEISGYGRQFKVEFRTEPEMIRYDIVIFADQAIYNDNGKGSLSLW